MRFLLRRAAGGVQVKKRMGDRSIVIEDATCLITKTTEHAQPPHSDVQPWHAHMVGGIIPADDVRALEVDEATYQIVAQLQLVATTPDYGVLHVCPGASTLVPAPSLRLPPEL
jgi:hypothetical protein